MLLPATQSLKMNTILMQGVREGDVRKYDIANLRLPESISPWDACAAFMEHGYLPPFEWVRQLHEEQVVYGDVAKRLWILRGARRTARLVQEASLFALRQVHQLKKTVQRWR